MAATRLTNVIVPSIFTPYTIQETATRSNLLSSGLVTGNPALNQLASGGGSTFNLPFFNDLSGDSEIIEDNTSLTVNNLTTERQVGVALNRAKSFGSSFLAQYVSGEDPMRVIGDLVASYWVREEQKIVINILKALFGSGGPIVSTHLEDQSAAALTNTMMIDAIAKIGDAYDKLSTIVCHSAIYHSLRKLDLVQYVQEPSNLPQQFPSYMGMNIIVDDGVEVSGSAYTTYVFANGAFSRGVGTLDADDATEIDRDSLKSEDVLINRRRYIMHPNGFKWTGSPSGSSPTNTELATAGNWAKVFENKNIPVVALKSLVSA
ncbi:MAG: hypothetical protein CMP39_04305 [Rickettsiales bacterium]|nr:hypothetical protein [Rickettsiales bacterium]|tara:strand:- start:987 stop:1943 length:957 start_codon:yes stop_codon:yes gene_type:complete